MYRLLLVLNIKNTLRKGILLLIAVYPGFIYNTQRILTENIFSLFLVMAVYYYLYEDGNEKKNSLITGICIACAFFIKPVAIIAIFLIVMAAVLNKAITLQNKILRIACYLIPLIICIGAWEVRNYIAFGELFFSRAGNGPIIWGLLPYFIGIFEIKDADINHIFYSVYNLNPLLFLKWKIFGQLQYMWGDIWDENITHPFALLKYLGILHYAVVIFVFMRIPKLIRAYSVRYMPIFMLPMLFSCFYFPFHGLARYVWPSIPFLFISLAVCLNKKAADYVEEYKAARFLKWCASRLAGVFAVLIVFSVLIFPSLINKEMSEYGLLYRGNISMEELQDKKVVYQKQFYFNDEAIEMLDFKVSDTILENGSDTGIIKLNNLKSGINSVSKIDIVGKGGFLFDYSTVYWKLSANDSFNESLVYRIPTNSFQSHRSIWIYGDVESLMIVPIVLKHGKYDYRYIEVTKYAI
jgi:hypothetical protein